MNGNACPLPNARSMDETQVIERLLNANRIAIVGLSDDPARPSHEIGRYLLEHDKEIIPVNPNCQRLLGLKCYASLSDVPGPIDLVNVFRRQEHCPEVVRQAIKVGAKGIWLQSGILSEKAKGLAQRAGIDFVQNKCIMVEHRRR